MITARDLTDPARRKAIDRKTDYVLSYSHRHPATSALYKQLEEANVGVVGHTMDVFTKRTAFFSGFEIKPASGDQTEAELQISIWSAASIRKKQELASLAQLSIEPAAMVEPMFTIVGHKHHVYYCCPTTISFREEAVSTCLDQTLIDSNDLVQILYAESFDCSDYMELS